MLLKYSMFHHKILYLSILKLHNSLLSWSKTVTQVAFMKTLAQHFRHFTQLCCLKKIQGFKLYSS